MSEEKRACGEYEAEEWASEGELLMTWPEWCDMFNLKGVAVQERVGHLPFLESIQNG